MSDTVGSVDDIDLDYGEPAAPSIIGSAGINIRGAASGPYAVIAQNFAPGTSAADIESVMQGVGGDMAECRLIASNPTVIAEMHFLDRAGAEAVIKMFNNKKVCICCWSLGAITNFFDRLMVGHFTSIGKLNPRAHRKRTNGVGDPGSIRQSLRLQLHLQPILMPQWKSMRMLRHARSKIVCGNSADQLDGLAHRTHSNRTIKETNTLITATATTTMATLTIVVLDFVVMVMEERTGGHAVVPALGAIARRDDSTRMIRDVSKDGNVKT